MSILVLLGIALGLGADAMAVALGTGVKLCDVSFRQSMRMSLAFGFFQFIMPVIGFFIAGVVTNRFTIINNWIAFGLLVFVSFHMIWNGIFTHEQSVELDQTKGLTLLLLSVATSIDALAVGFSFSILKISILFPSLIIGIITFIMTFLGLKIGCRFGVLFGKNVEIAGGIIILIIGIKIILEGITK